MSPIAPGCRRNDASRAVETMLEVITSTLEARRRSAAGRVRQFLGDPAQGLDRAQPAHRRADADQGQLAAQVPPGKVLKDAVQ
jgi:hypothetical protein